MDRRVEALVDELDAVQRAADPPAELLARFQSGYRALPAALRPRFFQRLVERLEVRREALEPALAALAAAEPSDAVAWSRRVTALRRAAESPRLRAFRRFLKTPGGLRFLLDLRADVLAAQRRGAADLEPLDEEIAHLFESWFQQGFLFLEEITQDSPYRRIHFLKEHELVHPMTSLDEMGRRLGKDRRCFGLCHRVLPDEPVVFIEVALTRGVAGSIHEILEGPAEPAADEEPDTAIFYSINNTQTGLAGLGLGKVLVFQVVDELRRRHPNLRTFATLSPIPGFWERYLRPLLRGEDTRFAMTRERAVDFFSARERRELLARLGGEPAELAARLAARLDEPDWIEDDALARLLRRPLTRLAYFYLTEEKNPQGRPLNPVAGFHLGNGATVAPRNVRFGANRSERGLRESCGLMVNYLYSPSRLERLQRTVRRLLPWQA